MDINKVIGDAVDKVSLKTANGMVDLNDAYHVFMVQEELKKHIPEDIVEGLFDKQIISEAKSYSSFKNASVWEENGSDSEKAKFESFFTKLPTGAPLTAATKVLGSLSSKEVQEFYTGLGSKGKSIKKFASNPLSLKSGLETKIFDIDAKGIGKGEIYLAWVIDGGEIQGGNTSFDIKADTNYEVKDYTAKNNSAAIRAGVEASVSKFDFWKEVLRTIETLKKMEADGAWDVLSASSPAFAPVIQLKDYLLDRVQNKLKIVNGEYNKEDTRVTREFYTIMSSLLGESDNSVNQVIFQGPGVKPMSYEIEPINANDIKSGIKIDFSSSKGSLTQATIINYLKKLKYVRDPKGFDKDIQKAIDEIIGGGQAKYWVIFRGKSTPQMKVIPAEGKNFNYSVISQNGIKFKELE